MTKSRIEDLTENAQYVARCPYCPITPGLSDRASNQMGPGSNGRHARGRYRGLPRSHMPDCPFCQGLGVVFLNRVCECGMPAIKYDEKRKVWTCGNNLCIDHASWRASRPTGSPANWQEWYGA